MDFSSNQRLCVSGENETEYVSAALDFALKLSGQYEHMNKKEYERGCKFVYQITPNHRFCIGWGFETIPDGWKEFELGFDFDIAVMQIVKYLREQRFEEGDGDGSYSRGFLMRGMDDFDYNERKDIENPFYGIVAFEPFSCYHAK